MENDPRYVPVDQALPEVLPPCSREEATRAMKRIIRHFGGKQHGGPDMLFRVSWRGMKVRKCWVSTKPTKGHDKGWGRLIHDVSHRIHRRRHPQFMPHHGVHALLEREIAEWVVAQGFLTGKLKSEVRPKRLGASAELDALDLRLKRWTSKFTRAQNAIRKLQRRRKVLEKRVVAHGATTAQEG